MRQAAKQNRIASVIRGFLRCTRGDSLITSLLLTGAGIAGVSMVLPTMQDSAKTAGNALRNQAGVLARGSDTGSTGFGSGGSSSGMDFGSFTSAASQFGSFFGKAVDTFGKAAEQFGDIQNQGQGDQGQKP